MISESTRQEVAPILKLGKQMEVRAKGIEHPITLSEVVGISGPYKLLLPEIIEMLVPLPDEIPLRYEVVEGAQLGGELSKGGITRLSLKEAVLRLESPVQTLSNLNIHVIREKRRTSARHSLRQGHGTSAGRGGQVFRALHLDLAGY